MLKFVKAKVTRDATPSHVFKGEIIMYLIKHFGMT